MSGFVAIERDLFVRDFFAKESMSETEAWIWLIANVRWKDGEHRVGGSMYDVPRGSIIITLRKLQSAFMWRSDTRVRNYLKRLKKADMVTFVTVGQRNASKTHVTICNYEEYQAGERTRSAPKTHGERTKNAVKKQGNKGTIEDISISSKGDFPKSHGFDEFWRIWPSKKNKECALSAWEKLSIENKRKAFSAIQGGWFDRWRAESPDANPIHASTFLNKKRFDDEVTTPTFKAINGGQNGQPSKSERRTSAFISGAKGA